MVTKLFFDNASNISNIFSRVTGGNISNIDGAIRANDSASLFLINPAGILFGNNARLDIGGSFYGSSASSILFEDGEFSAVDNLGQPVLTINAPIGLGFRDEPGDIVNRSFAQNSIGDFVGLEVVSGNTLAFVGGELNFESGQATARGGNIHLGGLEEAGTVIINQNSSLSFPEDTTLANINLTNATNVNVLGTGGGNIAIDAQNLSLSSGELGSSQIRGGIASDSTSTEAQAGNININVAEEINLDNSRIINQVSSDGVGNSGNITITTGSIEAINGGDIDTTTFGRGNGGNISITATEDLTFDGRRSSGFSGGITSLVNPGAVGNAGNITISMNNLTLTNSAKVDTSTLGQGNAGDINIAASEDITIDSEGSNGFPSGIISSVRSDAVGDAGDVTISTNNLTLTNGGTVNTSIGRSGQGNAGDINITATGDLTFSGQNSSDFFIADFDNFPSGLISSVVGSDAVGNAGDVTISTNNLTLTEKGVITVETQGRGDAGSIDIKAFGDITIVGGDFSARFSGFSDGITSGVGVGAVGNGGKIDISTTNLSVTNESEVSSNTDGQGNSGNINITATNSILLDRGSISSEVATPTANSTTASGNAGNIEIATSKLTVTDSTAFISASTFSDGNAGNLSINAAEFFTVTNDAVIQANVFDNATGTSGDLTIETANLSVTNGAQISALTRGEGDAGNLTIRATDSVLITGETGTGSSALLAIAVEEDGKGGELNIFTQNLTVSDNAISSVGNFPTIEGLGDPGIGEPGDLNIQADSINVESGGRIAAATQSSIGEGANINLDVADSITLRDGSLISAQAFKEGNGGNLNIDTNFIIAFLNGNNDIVASAEQGNGGNININAESLFGIEERPLSDSTNDINASSEFSIDGTVNVSTPDVNPVQGATELPTNVVESEQTTQQACEGNRETAAKNGLNITGKGGIVPDPVLPLNSFHILVNGKNKPTSAIPAPIETSQGKIQPARGIKVTESGEIILTAYRTNNSGDRIPEVPRNCGRV